VRGVLTTGPGAWMVWCDPRGDWAPLLQQAATAPALGGFRLVSVAEMTAGELGSPRLRAELQARLVAGESFVLHVPARADALGWLWAHALRAERTYDQSLRDQLIQWGWQPQSLTLTDDELAALAARNQRQDPAAWSGGGLQPDPALLLEVLAGGAAPDPADRLILDLTVEQAGLPPLDEPLAGWRTRALARLLVTQAHAAAPDLAGAGHELLIAPDRRQFALRLLDHWLDSLRLSNHLPAAILEADKIAGLGTALGGATIEHGPFLSQAAERAVFANTCRILAEQSGQPLLAATAALGSRLPAHLDSFWGARCTHAQAIPWDELWRLSRAARDLLAALPSTTWATPDDAIAWYTGGGWRVDQAGEELLRDLTRASPELLILITPLRAAYRARWESLMLTWSDLWSSAGCPVAALKTAGDWLREQLLDPRPTVVLVVDALRYGLGVLLAQAVNTQEGPDRATVRPARAPLPSITALGMGVALPIPEHKLEADLVEGKWQLHIAGSKENLSLAAERRKWWTTHGKVAPDALISMADVATGKIPPPTTERTRLVIYDDAIDKMGHDDELEAMGSGHIRERYLQAIAGLRQVGWLRILIVTDHGYIHWSGSEEKHVLPPVPGPAYSSRRALAYPATTPLPRPWSWAPGNHWRIALAPGAAGFQAYGGLGYFHGGASLQEWITPCVQIQWPVKAQPVGIALQPLDQILSERPRVTVNVIKASLFGENDLPRQVDVIIRDAGQGSILFRAQSVPVPPSQQQVMVEARALEGVTAARGTTLRIEVRDAHTEEVLTAANSILMTELTGW
jgi:hypothetical protein